MLLLGLNAASHSARAAAPAAETPRAMYDALYERADVTKHIRPDMPSPGEMAWGDSYVLNSYIAMYHGTRDRVHLERFAAHFDRILTARDSRTGRRDELRDRMMPSWGTGNYTQGKWTAWLVHAGMLTYPAASFVRIVRADRRLPRALRAKADGYLPILEEIVAAYDDEWRGGPGGEGYYHSPPVGALPLNQQNALGRTMVELAAVTRKAGYRDRATSLARYFKSRLRVMPNGAYAWEYSGGRGRNGEDISHAAINADFAALCYRNRIVFTREDMERFAKTFTENIMRPDGGFAQTVAGQGEAGKTYTPQLGRWLNLSPYDRRIYDAVLGDLHAHPEHRTLVALANLVRWDKAPGEANERP